MFTISTNQISSKSFLKPMALVYNSNVIVEIQAKLSCSKFLQIEEMFKIKLFNFHFLLKNLKSLLPSP